MTPEIGLREKLRQIRAASRVNQNSRSRSQTNTRSSESLTMAAMETRSVRQLSPPHKDQPLATVSTRAEDLPIPSLENVDGNTAETKEDRVIAEPALFPSSGPPQPVLDTPSSQIVVPAQVSKVEKAVSELDVSTMPLLHPCEFVVPLPVDGRIKHQYVAELAERYKDINDFLQSTTSPRLIRTMGEILRKLDDTLVHSDLGLSGPPTQVGSTAQEVLWAEDASSKFAFLAQLIDILSGSHHQIVVVARSGATLDLLHSYLNAKGVACRESPEAGSAEGVQGARRDEPIRYTLLATTRDSMANIPRSASLIIAFDASFDAAMLPEWCTSTRFVPVLLLLVVNSAEHVARCVPEDLPETERLRRLVKAVVHVHSDLGEMPLHVDYQQAFNLDQGARLALVKRDLGAKIAHAAAKTAEALQSNDFALNFTLRPISELDLTGLEDRQPSPEGLKETSLSASRGGTPGGQKRVRVSCMTERDSRY